jgi:hypothetical protein
MRWLVGLLGLLVVLCAGTLLAVVLIERDPTGEELRRCADDAGARRIDGADSLGPLRVDLLADTLSVSRPQTLANGYRATYLRPEDGSYLAVAVAREDQGDLDSRASALQSSSSVSSAAAPSWTVMRWEAVAKRLKAPATICERPRRSPGRLLRVLGIFPGVASAAS